MKLSEAQRTMRACLEVAVIELVERGFSRDPVAVAVIASKLFDGITHKSDWAGCAPIAKELMFEALPG